MDLSASVENEHFCLRLMAGFGLAVAETRILQFEEVKALAVTRFDRLHARDGRLLRLPQEDMCQALSVPPSRKYQSEGGPGIVEITALLRGSDQPQQDQADFFKAAVLFWLIAATDGHAKNFSIGLRPGGRFALTPLYDVLSVQPSFDAGHLQAKEMKLAMRAGKNRHYKVEELTGRHFVETGVAAGLSRIRIAEIFEAITVRAEQAFSVARAEMPSGFPQDLATSIRQGFERRVVRLG